jgi:copper(I)-binding protein
VTGRLVLFIAVMAGACSGRRAQPPLEVRDAWARPADSAATTGAYFVLLNHDSVVATLSAESSPSAESASLHETMDMGGTMHMMALESPIAIAPGDSLVLRPGARHLMVSGLTRRLVAGDTLPLVLTFIDGRTVRAGAVIRAP